MRYNLCLQLLIIIGAHAFGEVARCAQSDLALSGLAPYGAFAIMRTEITLGDQMVPNGEDPKSNLRQLEVPSAALDLAILSKVRRMRAAVHTPSDEPTSIETLSPSPRVYILYHGEIITMVNVGSGQTIKEQIGLAEAAASIVQSLPKQRGPGYEAWLIVENEVVPVPIVQGHGPGLPDMRPR